MQNRPYSIGLLVAVKASLPRLAILSPLCLLKDMQDIPLQHSCFLRGDLLIVA